MVLACEQAPLAVTITASPLTCASLPRTLNARAQSANVSLLADYDGLETGHFLDCWKSGFLSKRGGEREAIFFKQEGNDWDETWTPHSQILVSKSENAKRAEDQLKTQNF